MNLTFIQFGLRSWLRVRGSITGLLVYLTILFVVEGSFWNSLSSHSGHVGNYTSRQILFYIFSALLISQITACNGEPDQLSEKIESGTLDSFLLRPLGYLPQMLSIQLGFSFARLLLLFPVCLILSYFLLGWVSLLGSLQTLILILFSSMINFLINQILSTFTFYFRESYALVKFKETLFAILAGTLIPLDIFPEIFQKAVLWSPSSYLSFFPTKVLMGEADFFFVLRQQCFFFVLLFLIAEWTWTCGVRKYQAFGG